VFAGLGGFFRCGVRMKIKKVELAGFKSFVDRTILHFDHDVLGVVGPNGCGKSNIVDAIRWCMGEQSARHLRGRLMDDVIFSGSDSRKANDMAEVTLTFENDRSEELPAEYKDYAEVAVTRRLYRTGESEYLINKTLVRLRDVTDLFLGTGAGTKAYSIVEQGKVGLIVSAKPEERRLLIEEAAGITRFKSRKKQAERKMELTQQNLLRVGDIVAEIERGSASLKRQAAKAERYVAYRNEVEDLQLHEAAHRYLETIGYIKLAQGQVESVGQAAEEARANLLEREQLLDGIRSEAHAEEQRLEAAQGESFAADGAVTVQQAGVERARDRLGALTQRRVEMDGEQAQMASQSTSLTAEREQVGVEIHSASEAEAVQIAGIAEQEALLLDANRAHATAEASVVERRHLLAAARAEVASAEARLAGVERRYQEMVARRTRLEGERDLLGLRHVDMTRQAGDLAQSVEEHRSAVRHAGAEKARLDVLLGELKEKIRLQEHELDVRKTALSNARSRFAALRELRERLEGVGTGTKAMFATKDGCLAGLVADRIEVPADLTHALAGLLGTRLQSVVVSDLNRGIELLEGLAEGRKGRAAIVPARPVFTSGAGPAALSGAEGCTLLVDRLGFAPEDEALVRCLVGDAMVVQDVATALKLRQSGARAPLVTVDGTVLHADGRIEGGQGDELWAGLLESKREARELGVAIEQQEVVVARLLEALLASRQEIAEVGRALDIARQDVHTRDLIALTAEKDLQKNADQLQGVSHRIAALEAEEVELIGAVDEARIERETVAANLADAGMRIEATGEDVRHAEIELVEVRARRDSQRETLLARRVSLASISEKIAAARAVQARLGRNVDELQERMGRLEAEIVANVAGVEDTQGQLERHQTALQENVALAARAREALETVRLGAETLRAKLMACETELKDYRLRAEAIRDELQAHEMLLREKRLELEHLLASVADKFRGVHLPALVGEYHMRPCPDEVSRSRIEELVRLIDRMGSVNLDATRELAEAEERFTFYTTQKLDLEKALSDLQRALQQMNRESRRLFEETFEAVNTRFQEIFPRMFRGGRAELRMTNPGDLLETGIDIVAQPPGKKLSNIELMSGGEKALTAVSLIFAIFQIKPSPFCILDEVDAPLDDANVARYNETIRSMTDRSQFILITHHKRTMQMVDVLYGVTMPEAGVSKIVSVRINDSLRRTIVPPAAEVAVA
jgi:chromosome segregation protein